MIRPENFNKNLEQKRGPCPPLNPPPPPQKKKKIQIWILCQNSLTRELKIRVVGFVLEKLLTYFEMLIIPQCSTVCRWLPLFPQIFLSDLVLAPSSLHQPPPDKGHTVREYY